MIRQAMAPRLAINTFLNIDFFIRGRLAEHRHFSKAGFLKMLSLALRHPGVDLVQVRDGNPGEWMRLQISIRTEFGSHRGGCVTARLLALPDLRPPAFVRRQRVVIYR